MKQNYFELFGLPVGFVIDAQALDRAYHEVQARVHPDRFADRQAADKRVAVQWASYANQAYQALRNPLARAAYLCKLHGIDVYADTSASMSAAFLMRQIDWRESLQQARAERDAVGLARLERELQASRADEIKAIEQRFAAADHDAAASHVRQLMFVEKFGEQVGDALDEIAS